MTEPLDDARAGLLACPFCGGKAHDIGPYGEGLFAVRCYQCGADVSGFDQCLQDAIDAWNTRAAPAPQCDAGSVGAYEPFVFIYRNHRDETATRIVSPISVRFGPTEWHKQPQWLLRAFDHEKRAEREFAMADISATLPPSEAGREAIARIIDPTARFDYEIQRRDLAYAKADAILALSPDPGTVLNQGTSEAPEQRSGQPSAEDDAA